MVLRPIVSNYVSIVWQQRWRSMQGVYWFLPVLCWAKIYMELVGAEKPWRIFRAILRSFWEMSRALAISSFLNPSRTSVPIIPSRLLGSGQLTFIGWSIPFVGGEGACRWLKECGSAAGGRGWVGRGGAWLDCCGKNRVKINILIWVGIAWQYTAEAESFKHLGWISQRVKGSGHYW